ncbi:MAG: hypothetical protein QOG51_1576 [Verrucomicrobiota bacterium]|jgi:TRAP-type C4-dicarboxylate transport system permease small subunit
MALFTAAFRRELRRSLELFVSGAVVFAAAVALTYVEDWCRAQHRPEWVVLGVQGLSIFMFVADGIVVCVTCVKLIRTAIRDLFNTR